MSEHNSVQRSRVQWMWLLVFFVLLALVVGLVYLVMFYVMPILADFYNYDPMKK